MEENKKGSEIYPIEKEQKMLKVSYQMYENTLRDTKEHMEAAVPDGSIRRSPWPC